LLEQLRFETDYGVDLGLLIDAHQLGAQIEEVDIGHLEHESQTLEALGRMAKQVVRVLLQRAARHDRLAIDQIREVEEIERHSRAEFNTVIGSLGEVARLALFDMDGTLLRGRFVVELARRTGREAELAPWLDNPCVSAQKRSRAIAEVLRGIPKEIFERVAAEIPLVEGAVQTVIGLRKAGYRVGIVTDSYWIASEIVRRRVFADFSVANLIRFRNGICTGDVTIPPIFAHPRGCRQHELCKLNAALHVQERLGIPADRMLAVGDGQNDVCMLQASRYSFAFEPKSEAVRQAAKVSLFGDLSPLLNEVRTSLVTA
jgi:HAD superfamily phosphoserine phosphatase-like hydrolase